jgi:hypothetical protein
VEDIHTSLERDVLEEAGIKVEINPNFDQFSSLAFTLHEQAVKCYYEKLENKK